jgi:hypothetical protein
MKRRLVESSDLSGQLNSILVGQPDATTTIVPYGEMFLAGLNPAGRPAGIFLLRGPTGTGKTRTVEALAEVLHRDQHQVLRVNFGEYQMEHEVAKLVGSPPDDHVHRETSPILTATKLAAIQMRRFAARLDVLPRPKPPGTCVTWPSSRWRITAGFASEAELIAAGYQPVKITTVPRTVATGRVLG